MNNPPVDRRSWRCDYVDRFLSDNGISRAALTGSSLKWLDEWARQVQLVENQPSANFETVVLQLCKAVESELAAGIGNIPALFYLRSGTLGEKAKNLSTSKLDNSTKQQLTARGIKPGFVTSDLSALLSRLAFLRVKFDIAHGNAEIHTASMREAAEARKLAGQIIGRITAHVGGGSK